MSHCVFLLNYLIFCDFDCIIKMDVKKMLNKVSVLYSCLTDWKAQFIVWQKKKEKKKAAGSEPINTAGGCWVF